MSASFFTQEYSLAHWAMLSTRLEARIAEQEQLLTRTVTPLEVTLDMEGLGKSLRNKKEIQTLDVLTELDSAQLLAGEIAVQARDARERVGIPYLEIALQLTEQRLRQIRSVLSAAGEDDAMAYFDWAAQRLQQLELQGTNEALRAERQALKERVFTISVLAPENANSLRSLEGFSLNGIDRLKAQIQSLTAGTLLSVARLSERAAILAHDWLGVQVQAVEETPAPSPEPSQEPAAKQAAA